MTIWFTSDTHFGHANIIRHSYRPYTSVEEMDESLISNWNDCVLPQDEIYFLGDLTMDRRATFVASILQQLNGHKYLVYGNHDNAIRKKPDLQGYFKWCKDIAILNVHGHTICMCHYPMMSWYKSNYGAIHLHGHTHGTVPRMDKLRMDVGVDCNGYRPISLQAVIDATQQEVVP